MLLTVLLIYSFMQVRYSDPIWIAKGIPPEFLFAKLFPFTNHLGLL